MYPGFVAEIRKDKAETLQEARAIWQKQQKKARWEELRKRLKEAKQKSPH